MGKVQNEIVFLRAVKARFRTQDITAATHVAPKRVRTEQRAIHGAEDLPTGKKPSNPDMIFGSVEAHAQCSYYFGMLRSLHLISSSSFTPSKLEVMSPRGFDALLDAYYLYREQYPDPDTQLIDATKAVTLVQKFYRAHLLDMVGCRDCGSPYVVQKAAPLAHSCPWCSQRKTLLHQCHRCGSDLVEGTERCSNDSCRKRIRPSSTGSDTVYRCSAIPL